jgi:hypothetical protein
MEAEVIATGFSCETCVKNEYLGFEVYTTVTIYMMVIWVMSPCSPVNSHQTFVWRNLLPIFSMWERDIVHR